MSSSPLQAGKIKIIKQHYEDLESRKADLEAIIKATERFHSANANNPLSFGLTPEMYKYLQKAIKKDAS
ncbi:MAG: hypothetical protein A2189_05035 [Paenibacillus sp. RIFOXYA1_FULL_44_5]|nr:MAG: hypothetical protein A2189_05035 [Paenibacillus sp. RIFOXYA1_FULL_44_5]